VWPGWVKFPHFGQVYRKLILMSTIVWDLFKILSNKKTLKLSLFFESFLFALFVGSCLMFYCETGGFLYITSINHDLSLFSSKYTLLPYGVGSYNILCMHIEGNIIFFFPFILNLHMSQNLESKGSSRTSLFALCFMSGASPRYISWVGYAPSLFIIFETEIPIGLHLMQSIH
jgi:hypothetical protein